MADVADSTGKPSENSLNQNTRSLEETPWIAYLAQQAQLYQNYAEETFNSAMVTTKSRLSEIRSTSSAHFNQTLDSLQDVKTEYSAYENIVFGKLKEGVLIAASNPAIACGATLGLGVLVLKRPRQFLTKRAVRLFISEETLLSRAEAKVSELRQSINSVKSEGDKLEKELLQAEEEFKRGKLKLRQSGKQIQDVIRTGYKIDRQARGLKDIVGELPGRQAPRFRSEISNLASEAKQQRNRMNKELSKIINYGISV